MKTCIEKKEEKELTAVEKRRRRNKKIFEKKEKTETDETRITGEDMPKAKDILDTITVLNGQDDVGVDDFIKSTKSAKLRCSQPNILLDFIIAQRIKGSAEKAVRFIPIDSHEDLF